MLSIRSLDGDVVAGRRFAGARFAAAFFAGLAGACLAAAFLAAAFFVAIVVTPCCGDRSRRAGSTTHPHAGTDARSRSGEPSVEGLGGDLRQAGDEASSRAARDTRAPSNAAIAQRASVVASVPATPRAVSIVDQRGDP